MGVLAVIPGLVRKLGGNPDEVLAAAELHAEALTDPEGTIPYAAMGRLFVAAAEHTRCAHFGLLVGEHIGTAALGLVGTMMRNAPKLGAALRDFASHQHRNAHGSVVYLLREEPQAFFGYAVYQSNLEGYTMICDAAAMGGYNLIRELAPQTLRKRIECWLPREVPIEEKPYRSRFGVTLRFNSDRTGVLLPSESLETAIDGANSDCRTKAQEEITTRFYAGELDIVTRVRREIRVGLLNGNCSVGEIAAELAIHPRTLHRHLRAAGVSFQDALDETRYDAARQILSNTGLGIAEVGQLLGYSDASAFTRAFSRWAQVNPSEWRAKLSMTASG